MNTIRPLYPHIDPTVLSAHPDRDCINYAVAEFYAVVCDQDRTVKVFTDCLPAEEYVKAGSDCRGQHVVIGINPIDNLERECFKRVNVNRVLSYADSHGEIDPLISLTLSSLSKSAYDPISDAFLDRERVVSSLL